MDTEKLKTQFADYLCSELGRRPGTVKQYLWRLDYVGRLLGKPVQDITPTDLRTFKRDTELKRETVKNILVAVKQFHSWGVLEGLWPDSGLGLVRTPTINDSTSTEALGRDKVVRLLDECRRPLEYRLVYLGLYAGTRIAEAAAMNAEHWQEGVLRFRGKGNKLREVPVHPELEAVRDKILAWPPVHPGGLQKAKECLAAQSRINFVTHQLRKTFAASLYDEGVPDEVVKDLLGHSGSVTRLYAPITPKMRAEAVARLNYGEQSGNDGQEPNASADLRYKIPKPAENGHASVFDKAFAALERERPGLRWEVEMHLQTRPEGAQRAIRAVGLHTGVFFVLDCDDGVWHLPDEHNGIGALLTRKPMPTSLGGTLCERSMVEISDEAATFLLAGKPLHHCPVCIPVGFKSTPDLEPPQRVSKSWLMRMLLESQ